MDTGATSVEAVRRQLQGTWELTQLDLYSSSGEAKPTPATGRLQYDEYGNLSMQGTVNGGQDFDSSVLNLSGRVAIDPTTHTFRFTGVTAKSHDEKRVDPQLDGRNVRYYEFVGDLLKTTVKAANGSTTATATWKKIS